MAANNNPFTYGAMIDNPAQFVGRRRELQLVIDRLRAEKPQGSAIFGERRIGKSSLLHYLHKPRAEESLRAPDNCVVFYISADDGKFSESQAGFRRALISELLAHERTYIGGSTWTDHDLGEAQEVLATGQPCSWVMAEQVLTSLPYHPVICLDEFEALADPALQDVFDDRFFNALRHWANEGRVTWITATRMPLEELNALRSISSPFFNLLANIELGGLEPVEVKQLLDRANTRSDVYGYDFSLEERQRIKQLGGTHPYHLQIVAAEVWGSKASNMPIDWQEVRDDLYKKLNLQGEYSTRRYYILSKQDIIIKHNLCFNIVLILIGLLRYIWFHYLTDILPAS
ncbi:MAG: AAA family ATPase [Chloroflexota bacterium]